MLSLSLVLVYVEDGGAQDDIACIKYDTLCPNDIYTTFFEYLKSNAAAYYLLWIPKLAASFLTLHLGLCSGYVGLVHLNVIDAR